MFGSAIAQGVEAGLEKVLPKAFDKVSELGRHKGLRQAADICRRGAELNAGRPGVAEGFVRAAKAIEQFAKTSAQPEGGI